MLHGKFARVCGEQLKADGRGCWFFRHPTGVFDFPRRHCGLDFFVLCLFIAVLIDLAGFYFGIKRLATSLDPKTKPADIRHVLDGDNNRGLLGGNQHLMPCPVLFRLPLEFLLFPIIDITDFPRAGKLIPVSFYLQPCRGFCYICICHAKPSLTAVRVLARVHRHKQPDPLRR